MISFRCVRSHWDFQFFWQVCWFCSAVCSCFFLFGYYKTYFCVVILFFFLFLACLFCFNLECCVCWKWTAALALNSHTSTECVIVCEFFFCCFRHCWLPKVPPLKLRNIVFEDAHDSHTDNIWIVDYLLFNWLTTNYSWLGAWIWTECNLRNLIFDLRNSLCAWEKCMWVRVHCC